MKTQVIFRYCSSISSPKASPIYSPTTRSVSYGRKEVIALFPYEIADMKGNCLSYQHVGQHGAASYSDIISESRPATTFALSALESNDLKQELKALGYQLKVIKRRNRGRYMSALAEKGII